MNELIKINETNINGELVKTVNARDLYEFLGFKRDFSHWIKDRIEKYGFVIGLDYTLVKNDELYKSMPYNNHVHNKVEYYIIIDMAKEISIH